MVNTSEERVMGGLSGPAVLRVDDRLTLEHTRLGDAQDMFNLVDQNRDYLTVGMPSMAGYTFKDAQVARRVVGQLSQAGAMFDYWIVEHGQRVGNIELVVPVKDRKAEMGYWLIEEAQGRGLATGAARRLLDYAFNIRALPSVTMWIRPSNGPSQRLARRVGATITGQGSRERFGEPITYNIWEVPADVHH